MMSNYKGSSWSGWGLANGCVPPWLGLIPSRDGTLSYRFKLRGMQGIERFPYLPPKICPPRICECELPWQKTIFADIIPWRNLKRAHHALGCHLNPMTNVLTREERGEGNVKREAEIGVKSLRDEEGQGWPAATRSQQSGIERIVQPCFRRTHPLTPDFRPLASRTVRERSSIRSPRLWSFVTAAPGS